MRKINFLLLVFLYSFTSVYSQAELTVSSAFVSNTTVNKGGYLIITSVIENSGNTTSNPTNVTFHLTLDFQVGDDDIIGELFIPSLEPNQLDTVRYLYSVPFDFEASNYLAAVWVDQADTNIELNEQNAYCVQNNQECEIIAITNFTEINNKLPYPIIFIHGLESGSHTWTPYLNNLIEKHSLGYGGDLKYCLNPDGVFTTSDFNEILLDFTSISPLQEADLYTINFNVDRLGNINDNNGLSNQSAIYKQGVAVQKAVDKVLELTGKEKVILVGHSMGGLAIRQYLQLRNWQNDGKHHVAKIFTIDSPHGGSIAATLNLGGIDIRSEAVRDLRYDDFMSEYVGSFIDGGLENLVVGLHYNSDVNINGIENDLITGINQRSFPNDIEYACSIAELNDFIILDFVEEERANLNNYIFYDPPFLPVIKPVFLIDGNHSSILSQFYGITQGIDETDDINIPTRLELDYLNLGFTTFQDSNLSLSNDIDIYELTLEEYGNLQLAILNITSPNFSLSILSENNTLVYYNDDITHQLNTETLLDAGTYYLRIEATPITQDHHYYIAATHTAIDTINASFTISKNNLCVTESVNFANQSEGNPTDFRWEFEGGTPNTSSEENPIVEYSTPGIYGVRLIVSNDSIIDTLLLEDYIIVDDFPQADFGIVYDSQTSVSFPSFSFEIDPNKLVIWDFGDGVIDTVSTNTQIHDYNQAGTYNVTLTIQNFCGEASITKEVIIEEPEQISANFSSNITIDCVPFIVEYEDISDGNPNSWEWYFEGGLPETGNGPNVRVQYDVAGNFDVSLAVSNLSFSDSTYVTNYLFANEVPSANFEYILYGTSTFEFINRTTNENNDFTYKWDFDDGNTSNEVSPTHTYDSAGIYDVTLTVTNDCGSNTYTQSLDIMISSIDHINENKLNIIPNPNHGTFRIIGLNQFSSIEKVDIIDISGRNIDCKKSFYEESLEINCSDLNDGIYILRVRDRDGMKHTKFVIQSN